MDVVEKGVTYVKNASQIWNILLTSLSDHVNDNIRSGNRCVDRWKGGRYY